MIVADAMGKLYTRQPPPDGTMHNGAQLGDLVSAISSEPNATLPLLRGVSFGREQKVILPTPPVDA